MTITNSSKTAIVGPLYVVPVLTANSPLRGLSWHDLDGEPDRTDLLDAEPWRQWLSGPRRERFPPVLSTLSVVDLRTYTPRYHRQRACRSRPTMKGNHNMKSLLTLVALGGLLLLSSLAQAQTHTITFDTDAAGNAIA